MDHVLKITEIKNEERREEKSTSFNLLFWQDISISKWSFFQGSTKPKSLQSNAFQCSAFSIWWVNWKSAFWLPWNENTFRFILFDQLTKNSNIFSALSRSHLPEVAQWMVPTLGTGCSFSGSFLYYTAYFVEDSIPNLCVIHIACISILHALLTKYL